MSIAELGPYGRGTSVTKVYLKVLIKFYPYWLRDLGPYFSPNDYRTRHASKVAFKGGKVKVLKSKFK